jgi:ABC-type Zn uptake system ZnuABC Zn-binding protein ZnuA
VTTSEVRWVTALLAAATLFAAGCSQSQAKAPAGTPVLTVTTGVWALGQMARDIGGAQVTVDDPVPPGTDPSTWNGTMQPGHGLVVYVPGLGPHSPTGTGPTVLTIGPSYAYAWLDPAAAPGLVAEVSAAMQRADPAAAGSFRSGAEALDAEIQSMSIDFSSTLSACRSTTMVTPDNAFSAMAVSYGLRNLVAGAIGAAQAAAAVRRSGALFDETWAANGPVDAVAAAAGVKTHSLDTLVGPPPAGYPKGATYTDLLEQDLGVLNAALSCDSDNQ